MVTINIPLNAGDLTNRCKWILENATFNFKGELVQFHLSPSSTECSRIAGLMEDNNLRYNDECRNAIWNLTSLEYRQDNNIKI